MSFINNVKKFFAGEEQKQQSFDILKQFGASGTAVYSGFVNEEYVGELNGQSAISTWNQMRSSDAVVSSVVRAMQLVLTSAQYTVQGENEEHVEFLQQAFFRDLEQNWTQFLEEAFNYPVFGFYYFEKIFKIREDGKVVWKEFAPRIPSAHYRWPIENDDFVIQQLKSTDETHETEGKTSNPKIPWSKLLYFVYQKEGKNFEGRSILRPIRQAWLYKQKMLKILMVFYERYGVGIPVYGQKQSSGADKELIEQMLSNIRANEQSYIVKPNVEDTLSMFGAETQVELANSIREMIAHLNKEIAKAMLANFLTSGDDGAGSYAKSSVDIDFFLLSMKSIGRGVTDVLTKAGEELIELNFGKQDVYPKLTISGIEKTDAEKFMNSMKILVETGFVSPEEEQLNNFVREKVEVPVLSDEERAEIQEKKEKQMELQIAMLKKQEVKEESKEEPEEEDEEEFSEEDMKRSIAKEKLFQATIDEEEEFLQSTYDAVLEPMLIETEEKVREFLLKSYAKLKTEIVNGAEVIVKTGNQKAKADIERGVKDIMAKFEAKMLSSKVMDYVHKESSKKAVEFMKKSNDIFKFADFEVSEGDFSSFIFGYKSNMTAFVSNEGRRVVERVNDNLTLGSSLKLTMDQVKDISFNKNIFKLSAITHPRGLFKNSIYSTATNYGISYFKGLVPKSVEKNLDPAGITAGLAFSILTVHQWNKENGLKDNVNVVGGMGVHHNDQMYFMPIREEELDEQEEITKIQRKKFNSNLQ